MRAKQDELAMLREVAAWAYAKLQGRRFQRLEDSLELARLKLYVEHGDCKESVNSLLYPLRSKT